MSDTDYPIYDFDPRNLPEEVLRAVGLMAMASAQTESVMQQFIGGLLGIDNLESISVGAHMAAPLKDNVARALIELNGVDSTVVDEVDDLLDAIKEALGRRNIVVHNAMMRHPDTDEIFSYRESARGSLQVSLQPVSVEQIQKDALLIYKVGMDLMAFMASRSVQPPFRTRPVYAPIRRTKEARARRRNLDP